MAVRIGNRLALSQLLPIAIAETKLAARAIPKLVRHLVPIVLWALASIGLGIVVGLAAVILPPMGAFGIVAAAGVALLWVMPDLPLVSPGLIRKTFFVMLIADLCIPYYYSVQLGDLPWISARRLATFTLIVPFTIAMAASSDARRIVADRIRSSGLIFVCAIGYLGMATLSVGTSALPSESGSALVEAILSWYVPFFAMIYIPRDNDDVIFILKIICVCALFNTVAGVIEFSIHSNLFVDIFPRSMLNALINSNPTLQDLLPDSPRHFRNGFYRAAASFVTSLSFGELEIIVIPIGLFFALHRKNLLERGLGWMVVFSGIVGIFASGSRGGYVGVLLSLGVFVVAWAIRKGMSNRASLAPAIIGSMAASSFVVVIGLITFWRRAHNMVLGGGAQAGSTQARYEQWLAGIPFIKSNPITGHGFTMGGYLIQSSIDSYFLSLILETGVPGFVFFTGLLVLPVWYGLRSYISDQSESSAIAGVLACSFIAFISNRLVLSQRENHMLIFSLLAIVVVMNHEYAKNREQQSLNYKPARKTGYRTQANLAGREGRA